MKTKEEEKIFKGYLRLLMRDLKGIQKAIREKNQEEAERLIADLIKDTQKDIED